MNNPDPWMVPIFNSSLPDQYDIGYSMALQADGKILLGGRSYDGTNEVFGLARYSNDLGIGLNELGALAIHAELLPTLVDQRTTLTFDMPSSGPITCELFNMEGQRARTFIHGELRPAGPQTEKLDLTDLASGAYTLSLTIGEHVSHLPLVKQ